MIILFKILAILGPALFSGMLLAIGVILGRYWKSLPPADFLGWFASNSGFIMFAIPFGAVPTILGLAGMLWIDWGNPAIRPIWLLAAGCIVALFAITFVYYVPANAAFAAREVPVDDVPSRLDAWLLLHNLRILLALAAAGLGVWAIGR
ncbi:MAG TPA: anthrone oxygenase family protein [Pseudorhizobium sp.]|jgi:hypothetical protein|nr:anthrone oxygenase family protein [Pseudorhizobium sp.]